MRLGQDLGVLAKSPVILSSYIFHRSLPTPRFGILSGGRNSIVAGYFRISRKHRKRSGVSEIIGSLLMIVIVVGLSAIIFAYATNGFSGMGSNLSNLFSSSGNAIQERVVVEQVTFNETGSHLGANLYVRNDGINPTIIAAIYVTNISASKVV